jgi:hypothetical protein
MIDASDPKRQIAFATFQWIRRLLTLVDTFCGVVVAGFAKFRA